jgi:hypothetical protein
MRKEEATKTMDLFEGAQDHKHISKRALKNWVVMVSAKRIIKLYFLPITFI